VHGVGSRSRRLAAAWLLGAVLGVLALSHVPGAAVWTGTSADTVSGSKIVAMPVAKRLQPTAAELGQSVDAVLPPALVLILLAGLVAAALVEQARRPRSGPRPGPARGPPSRCADRPRPLPHR
jgi:hypothetical protein